MPRNRMTHEQADSTYEDRRIARLQRGQLHSPKHPLRAEIRRNESDGFFVWLRGWDYPTVATLPDFAEAPRAAEDALDALVSNGYALEDPGHLIELYDLFDEPVSQNADSRDAAESPSGYIGYAAGNVQRMIDLMDAEQS